MKADLAKVNIDLNVQGLAWPTQWAKAKSSDTAKRQDILLFYWWPDYADPYSWFINLFHTEDPPYFNLTYYSNPELDSQMQKAEVLAGTEPATRRPASTSRCSRRSSRTVPAISATHSRVPAGDAVLGPGYVDNPAYPNVVFVYDLSAVGVTAERAVTRYVMRRVAQRCSSWSGVVVLTFVIARVIPGDPAAIVGRAARVAARARAGPATQLGLDLPLPAADRRYFSGVLRGDWGMSIHTHRPVARGHHGPGAGIDRAGRRRRSLMALVVGLPLGLVVRAMGAPRSRRAHPDRRGPRGLDARVLARVDPAAGLLPAAARGSRWPGQYDPNLDYTHPLTQYTRMVVVDALFTGQLDGAPQRPVAPRPARARRRVLPVRRDHADGPWLRARDVGRGPREGQRGRSGSPSARSSAGSRSSPRWCRSSR